MRSKTRAVPLSHANILRVVSLRGYDLVVAEALDAIGRRILELLVDDGRRSASEIGRLVNLSPAATKRRIDRLEYLG